MNLIEKKTPEVKNIKSAINAISVHELTNWNSNVNEEFSDQHQFKNKEKKTKRHFRVLVEKKAKEKFLLNYNLHKKLLMTFLWAPHTPFHLLVRITTNNILVHE
jgi:hypothetical protein